MPHVGFGAGRPSRFRVGRGGGNRLLGMRPAPISLSPRLKISQSMVKVNCVPMGCVGRLCDGMENSAKRVKPPPRGGEVSVFGLRESIEVRPTPKALYDKMRDAFASSNTVKSAIR